MLVRLKYGRSHVPLEMPDSINVEVIEPGRLPAVSDVRSAFRSSLENPIASPPLKRIIPPAGEVAIIVSDKTRPCHYPVVLPLLLDYLNAHGLPDDRMFLLVAYGAHPRHTDRENAVFYGEEILRRLRLSHHDCRDQSQLVDIGKTTRRTPVHFNKGYIEAGASVVLTAVSFHYFAGFGGGRKAIFPGLASEEGILNNHRIFPQSAGESLSNVLSFKGNVESNPLHDDLMEAVTMAPPTFVVNFCMNRQSEISGVFAGDWEKSHLHARQALLRTCVPVRRKYELVVASCGGHPKDINFIQSHKTIDNAFSFVRPGGLLLVLAFCEEGIGSESFLQWFEHADALAMRNELLKRYSMNGGTALALRVKADTSQIHLYSSIERAVVEKMGLSLVFEIQSCIDEILAHGRVKDVAILPEGAVTVATPRLNERETVSA